MSKVNLVVPMAGVGQRFVDAGYRIPKQLITLGEKQLLDISLDCIDLAQCNLIFVVRDDQVYNYHLDKLLYDKYGNDIKIVVTDGMTGGALSSCLLAEEYIDNDSPVLVYTLDVEFSPRFDPSNLLNCEQDGLILSFKANSKNYSYILTDPTNNLVTKVAEKKVISSHACVGLYGFKRGSDFCRYARFAIDNSMTVKGEFYIAPLYNLLIQDGLKITEQLVDKIHVFGTPQEFDFYRFNVRKIFGEKPIALCSDHSGFKAKAAMTKVLQSRGIKVIDFGSHLAKDCDYRDYIEQATKAIQEKTCDFAFGFCRTGQGVNICANKFKGIRAALIYDDFSAEMAIRHNCANFLSVPEKVYLDGQSQEGSEQQSFLSRIVDQCVEHSFDGGRHQMRVQNLEESLALV